MTPQRKRDVLIGSGLLVAVVTGVWFLVGRESGAPPTPAPTRTVEAPAVNPKEKATMSEEQEVRTAAPGPTTQEGMLREENLRVLRDNAIQKLKEGN